MAFIFKPLSYFITLAGLRHSSRVIRPKVKLGTSRTVLLAVLDFGSIPVGKTSSNLSIVINNIGSVDAVISNITMSSELFTVTYDPPGLIEAGSSMLVHIAFTPDTVTESPVDESIIITLDNDNEYVISLSGSGI